MRQHLALDEMVVFSQVWHDPNTPLLAQLLASLYSLEEQFQLSAGFLAKDEIIQTKLKDIVSREYINLTDSEYRLLVMQVLEDVKIVDPLLQCVYGTFSDRFSLYRDNTDAVYRKTRSDGGVKIECVDLDVASMETFGLKYDSDEDSLMEKVEFAEATVDAEVNGGEAKKASVADVKVDAALTEEDLSECKFQLHKMLDLIQKYHQNISLAFGDIDLKLAILKSQNSSDLEFLDKLTAHNELMCEKTHEMRADISEIYMELKQVKEKKVKSAPKEPYRIPLDSSFLDMIERGLDRLAKVPRVRQVPEPKAQPNVIPPDRPNASDVPGARGLNPQGSGSPVSLASAELAMDSENTTHLRLLIIALLSILVAWYQNR